VAGISPRALFKTIINDPNFFNKLKRGDNFTVRTYERVQRYLDRNPPSAPQEKPKRRNGEG
jgi:hypothetical protein